MRLFPAIFICGAIATGSAEASSFLVLEPMKEAVGPSMVVLGAPAPMKAEGEVATAVDPSAADFFAVSLSIIAMAAEPASPVTNEKVAAIPQPEAAPKRRFDPAPMVIRGGIVGDAFAPFAADPSREQAEDTAQPGAGQPPFDAEDFGEQDEPFAPEPNVPVPALMQVREVQ